MEIVEQRMKHNLDDNTQLASSINARDVSDRAVAIQQVAVLVGDTDATTDDYLQRTIQQTSAVISPHRVNASVSGFTLVKDSALTLSIDFKQLLFPALYVVQTIYLWISCYSFQREYLKYFSNFFAFLSVDWVISFELPTLVTPLIQLFMGLVAFLMLLFFVATDDRRFSWYVARYVLKRDHGDITSLAKKTSNPFGQMILSRFPNPFGCAAEFPVRYDVEVLPVEEAMKIDRFVGIADDDIHIDDAQKHEDPDRLSIKDYSNNTFDLHRDDAAKQLSDIEQAQALQVASCNPALEAAPLEVVGIRCRHHKDRRLSPQLQTDVWPFQFAPQCAVVINGERCNASTGVIFSCQASEPCEDGQTCLCDYALCEHHYRGTLSDDIVADVLAALRMAQHRGLTWVVASVFVFLANVAYMPFVKTAIMIMACHPQYQCEFTRCHDFTDQKYLVAFYLSLCVVVLFGLGLPSLLTIQLYRRRRLLTSIFFAEEYHGKYIDHHRPSLRRRFWRYLGLDTHLMPSEGSATTKLGETSSTHRRTDVAPDLLTMLKLSEWTRFRSTDSSVLSTLYKTAEFRWIFISPILLLWKVILICPAVFLPSSTFEQAIGIAMTEVGFALFMFFTSPFINPVVDLMYRVSSVHQLLFLGIQNLDVADRYRGHEGHTKGLVAISFLYLAFCVGCVLVTILGPVLRKALLKSRSKKTFAELGLQQRSSASLYITPMLGSVVGHERSAVLKS